VLAALAADGTSEIHDVEWVERGYENLVDRLSALGANIQKVD
jgi:UDP-N-acetylglucosamine 1-carboxyvinyltransferase